MADTNLESIVAELKALRQDLNKQKRPRMAPFPSPMCGPSVAGPMAMAWLLSWLAPPYGPPAGNPAMIEAMSRFAGSRSEYWHGYFEELAQLAHNLAYAGPASGPNARARMKEDSERILKVLKDSGALEAADYDRVKTALSVVDTLQDLRQAAASR